MCYFPDTHQGFTRVTFRFQDLLEQLADEVPIFEIKLVVVAYLASIVRGGLSSEQCEVFEPPEDGSTQLQWHYNYFNIMNCLILKPSQHDELTT
jgi:hypothetical protein